MAISSSDPMRRNTGVLIEGLWRNGVISELGDTSVDAAAELTAAALAWVLFAGYIIRTSLSRPARVESNFQNTFEI